MECSSDQKVQEIVPCRYFHSLSCITCERDVALGPMCVILNDFGASISLLKKISELRDMSEEPELLRCIALFKIKFG